MEVLCKLTQPSPVELISLPDFSLPSFWGVRLLDAAQRTNPCGDPRKPDIAELDARAKPHFDRAKQNIPAVVEELTGYGSMVKFNL